MGDQHSFFLIASSCFSIAALLDALVEEVLAALELFPQPPNATAPPTAITATAGIAVAAGQRSLSDHRLDPVVAADQLVGLAGAGFSGDAAAIVLS
jgi:hypothetical protein